MAFAPFGHGHRKCPGTKWSKYTNIHCSRMVRNTLTYIEVSVFLTILLQQFTIEPVGGAKEVGSVYGLITAPKEPLKCYVHPIKE